MPLSPAGMKASRPSSSRMMQPKRLQCNTLPRWCSTALLLGSGDRRGLYFDEDLVRFCQPELFVDERHEIFGSVQLLDPRAQILLAALQRRILALGLHDLSVQPDVFCTDAPYLSTNSAADEQQGNRKIAWPAIAAPRIATRQECAMRFPDSRGSRAKRTILYRRLPRRAVMHEFEMGADAPEFFVAAVDELVGRKAPQAIERALIGA